MRKHLMYTGLCLSLFAFAAGLPTAQAQIVATEDITVTVAIPNPDVITTPLSFGTSYYAQNHATATATATVSAADVLTNATGTAGSARLIPISTAGAAALDVNVGSVTAGVPSAAMTLQIRDNVTPANVFVILTGTTTPANATFRVDTWTGAAQVGGGTLTGFSGATGNGTLTLTNTGTAHVKFGATLRTVPGAAVYSAQDHVGTVRLTLSY